MSRLNIVSLVSGLLLLVGTPLLWQLAQPAETVGDVPPRSETAPEPELESEPEPDPEPGFGTEPTPQPRPLPEPDPEPEPEPELVGHPVSLAMPSIGVRAPVVDVGLEDDGAMEIPHDIATVGWYELGVSPGEPTGTAVISGHVDSREQGRGAFWDLRRLDVDDVISVDHDDGTTSQWRVTARTSYPKDELPIADIFTRFGDTRLVLITCGGAFDNTTRRYEDNVVVYTEPVDA